ncbi:MAG: hypothetical protein CMJ79_02585 [Planctomycetaceae bacterium]|nr:hypothetical protein [Planctomycetaceae bacterium]|tara:strand:- start:2647 stop:5055 length:2409 start_codon:yes stop_codon:yes gene_type:complete
MNAIARLLGIKATDEINEIDIKFAAWWSEGRPVLVLLVCLGLAALGVYFYSRYQNEQPLQKKKRRRLLLTIFRSGLLAILGFILAEPIVSVSLTEHPRPLLLMLFDGSDSMNLVDELSPEQADALDAMTPESINPLEQTRLELLNHTLKNGDLAKAVGGLHEKFDLRFYTTSEGHSIRELDRQEDSKQIDGDLVADIQTTAIGSSLDELNRRHGTRHLAGVVVVSDFGQNAGNPALTSAEQLDVPVFAAGVGPQEVVDVAITLQAPLVLKQDENTSLAATLRQQGATGAGVSIQLFQRRLGTATDAVLEADKLPIGPPVAAVLEDGPIDVDLPYLPEQSGRFEIIAEVSGLPGEVSSRNNEAIREVIIRDESLNLFFVEHEPTWEWRFVKEVFHRDPLIGHEGFRTFLRSADFKVRQSNDLFVDRLVRPRDEFFANDVVLISDVPSEMLTTPFQDQLVEYVERFGGGLVVIAGPRFSVGALQGTQLADMLPVVVDRSLRPKPSKFQLSFTPQAETNPFVNLGDNPGQNDLAWNNMGSLPWYQPVLRAHPLATVLATHPTDKTVDNTDLQPIIATRRFGKGEVVYIGFNETWRLRRKYGERFYRQFWGQMIYRLGLGRALGQQKRFSPTTDLTTYQTGERVTVTVEAYNQNYENLEVENLKARLLQQTSAGSQHVDDILIPLARDNVVFETSIPPLDSGQYRLLVMDPETNEEFELGFEVTTASRERLDVVRNTSLQQQIGDVTGGQACELYELPEVLNQLEAQDLKQYTERQLPLWNTWFILLLVLLVMHTEWLARKLSNLR